MTDDTSAPDLDLDSFFFVDDDGNALPPEQATSVFIANDLQRAAAAAEQSKAAATSEPSEEEQDTSIAAWLAEHDAAAKKFLDAAGGFDAVQSAAAEFERRASAGVDDGDDVDVVAAGSEVADVTDGMREVLESWSIFGEPRSDEEEDEDDEKSATSKMQQQQQHQQEQQQRSFSRDYSDIGEDAEWILSKIVGRQNRVVVADDENGNNNNDNDDDAIGDAIDDSEAKPGFSFSKKRSAQQKKRCMYRCVWKHYEGEQPTWELRATLEELGYGDALRRYDEAHDALHRRRRATPPPRLDANQMMWRGSNIAVQGEMTSTIFESLFGGKQAVLSWIVDTMAQSAMRVTDIANCAPPAAAAAFLREWQKNRQTPVKVFHGTRREAIPAICRKGLIVPGSSKNSDVKVVSGSAFGVAVYTATTPSISDHYTSGCGMMFVCAGLTSFELLNAKRVTRPHANYVCFFESCLVCPVYLVRYTYDSSLPRAVPRPLVSVALHRLWGGVARGTRDEMRGWTADGTDADRAALAAPPEREGNGREGGAGDRAKYARQLTKNKPVTKRMLKQMPRSMKEVFGY